jgi:hypothetical protein
MPDAVASEAFPGFIHPRGFYRMLTGWTGEVIKGTNKIRVKIFHGSLTGPRTLTSRGWGGVVRGW